MDFMWVYTDDRPCRLHVSYPASRSREPKKLRRLAISIMELLHFLIVCTALQDIIITLIPASRNGKFGARNMGERVEIDAVYS
jgi:hypothetical protein